MEQNWEPRNKPIMYGELIYEKGGEIYNGEKITSSINLVGKTGLQHAQESIWNAFSYHLQK